MVTFLALLLSYPYYIVTRYLYSFATYSLLGSILKFRTREIEYIGRLGTYLGSQLSDVSSHGI